MAAQASHQPRPYNNVYLPNGPTSTGPTPGAAPLLPNQGRVIENGRQRILCVADVRGNLRSLNDLAKQANADFIIHTGDFGFYDDRSLDRIADKTLKHVVQYSPLISEDVKARISAIQPNTNVKLQMQQEQLPLSQLPLFLNKTYAFDVPVYTVWGACEDVQVLEKLRLKDYQVDNLHIIDEAHSRLLEVGGVKLRLLGLGGALVMHKLFDNGEGRTTIAGGQGTMWTTLLQMGELIDTANRVFDPSEVRVLVTHASPAREGLLNQLTVALKVDFSISAGLHFRYGSSYNEYSVNPSLDHYRGKLAASKASFHDVWETVRGEVEPAVADNEAQQRLLQNALSIVEKMPSTANGSTPFGGPVAGATTGQVDETAFKNMWNFNLSDAAYGWLIMNVVDGKVGTEMRNQGFNFSRRAISTKLPSQQQQVQQTQSSSVPLPTPTSIVGTPGAAQTRTPSGTAGQQGYQSAQQSRQNPQMRSQGAQNPSQARNQRSGPTTTTSQSSSQPAPTKPTPPSQAVASPNTSHNQSAKPATPQPATPSATNKASSAETRANGTPSAEDPTAPKSTPPPAEKKPSTGLFMTNVGSEDEAKNVLTEEDRAKVTKITTKGTTASVFFATPEDMQAALKNVSGEYKGKTAPGKPNVKVYEERRFTSNWSAGSRGGAQPSGGYRSGGASDSEAGRGGRGGSFRGRGRGGRGGRGSYNRGAGGDGATPASPSPAAAAGGS